MYNKKQKKMFYKCTKNKSNGAKTNTVDLNLPEQID